MLSAHCQDVEPRRWSVLPLETKVVGFGYAFSFGNVLFDPVLEAEDVNISFNTLLLTYVQPFKIGNKFSRVDVQIPYGFQLYEGLLRGDPARVNRSGFGDARLRFSINFTGAPAGNAQELKTYYSEHPVSTTFGGSIAITIPTGQYSRDQLLNVGFNQFVFRPQLGLVHTRYSWSLELTGSMYFFTDNKDFFNNSTRKQDPIFAMQSHLIKRFNNSIWASASVSYGLGGTSEVNGISSADYRTNLLSAFSAGCRISKFQNIKMVYLNSLTLRDIGSNTHSFILGWSHLL
jgi:hypothetical protein